MEIKPIYLKVDNKNITLIPTAHVSKDSAELVENLLNEIHPDSICIELDEQRFQSMKDPDKYRNTDIVKIIKEKRVPLMLINLILANYQKRLATNLDSNSGQEMLIGIRKSEEFNAALVLADRPVSTTFKRVWLNLTLKDKIKLLYAVIGSIFDDEEISEDDLKQLQQTDILNAAINELSKQMPSIIAPMITERDKYLASKIKHAPGNNIVAILGAAHTIGIQEYIYQDYDISEFEQIPPKKLSSKISGWIIPTIIIIAIIASFSIDTELGLNQLLNWILVNGTLASLGTLICGGHPLSILVAFITAPITSLNPLLTCGWFVGLTESFLRKPTFADFSSLNDINGIKDFFKNKVTRILLLVLVSSLCSSIGTFVSGSKIISSILTNLF